MATNGLYTYVNIDDGFFWGHGDDGKFVDVPLEVELSEGVHAIRVSNGSAGAPDIDRMTL